MRTQPLAGLIALTLSTGLLFACGDKDGDDTGSSGGDDTGSTDTDTDTDTDTTGTDTDTDTDTDTTGTDTDTDTDTDTTTPVEDCSDGSDNDDDGLTDCEDPDCTDECAEDCTDEIDNDADELIDCYDDECAGTDACTEQCTGGEDEDVDGDIDCADSDCAEDPACTYDFYATSTYTSSADPACDLDLETIGGEYVGDCYGCDFAFQLDPTVIEDRSAKGCEVDPLFSLLGDELYTQTYLAFWGDYYGGLASNVLAIGFDYYYYGYTSGPYWSFVAYESEYYGTTASSASFDGRELSWDLQYDTIEDYTENYLDYCEYEYDYSDASEAFDGDLTETEDVDCDGLYVDVWEGVVAEDGVVSVTVDTVSADTTFDPYMWVNGEDSCVVLFADDNFECTYPPPSYSCPSFEGEVPAGTWQLVVASLGNCAGDIAEYEITADGISSLTLIEDDGMRYVGPYAEVQHTGTGVVNIDLGGGGDTGGGDTGSGGGDTGETTVEPE